MPQSVLAAASPVACECVRLLRNAASFLLRQAETWHVLWYTLLRRVHKSKREVRTTEAFPVDRASLERDCEIEFFIASGPGGQHRNKVETGVRLTHRPSGLTVTATERRSQHANREMAFERMAERLRASQRRHVPRVSTRPSRASRERRLLAKRRASLTKLRRTSSAHPDE